MDINVTLKIEAGEIVNAINNLAVAIIGAKNNGAKVEPNLQVTVPSEPKKVADTESSGTANKNSRKNTVKPQKEVTPKPEVESEEEQEVTVTLEDVQTKLKELARAGKTKEVKALITEMGVAKVSDIPEDKYAEVMEKAEEL